MNLLIMLDVQHGSIEGLYSIHIVTQGPRLMEAASSYDVPFSSWLPGLLKQGKRVQGGSMEWF